MSRSPLGENSVWQDGCDTNLAVVAASRAKRRRGAENPDFQAAILRNILDMSFAVILIDERLNMQSTQQVIESREHKRGMTSKASLSDILSRPLNRGSVVIQIIDRFKKALLTGELKPGDYIPSESELIKSLGVGKSSVREAVKMLQAMGIVEVRRGQGTVIRETPGNDYIESLMFQLLLSKGVTQDFIDLRLMFEPAYTKMAMEKATPEDLARIEETIHSMERAIAAGEQTAEHDIAFHIAILESTHNPLVIRIGEIILKVYEAAIETSMQTIPDVNLEDHKRIFKAFREKNEEALSQAIHICSSRWEESLG